MIPDEADDADALDVEFVPLDVREKTVWAERGGDPEPVRGDRAVVLPVGGKDVRRAGLARQGGALDPDPVAPIHGQVRDHRDLLGEGQVADLVFHHAAQHLRIRAGRRSTATAKGTRNGAHHDDAGPAPAPSRPGRGEPALPLGLLNRVRNGNRCHRPLQRAGHATRSLKELDPVSDRVGDHHATILQQADRQRERKGLAP